MLIRFSIHLNPIATVIEHSFKSKPTPQSQKGKTDQKSCLFASSNKTTDDTKSKPLKCWMCEGNHKISTCQKILETPVEERSNLIKKYKLCFNCLSPDHMLNKCQSKFTCQVKGCNKRHHTILHRPKSDQKPKDKGNNSSQVNDNSLRDNNSKGNILNNPSPQNNVPSQGTKNCEIAQVHNQSSNENITFLQIVPVILKHKNKVLKTNVLLDSGSDITLISADVARKLNLEGTTKRLHISNALSEKSEIDSTLVNFDISSICKSYNKSEIHAFVVEKLNVHPNKFNISELKRRYSHLRNINFPLLSECEVGLLIGTDNTDLLLHREFIQGHDDEPIAVKTCLGWMLMGMCNEDSSNNSLNFKSCNSLSNTEECLIKNVEKFWEVESNVTNSKLDHNLLPPVEQKSLNILETRTVLENGHFEIPYYGKTIIHRFPTIVNWQ